ncbi:unnamed protein product [Brachionus calyciflorus]|uniref:Uncharacterized protein n=1 Tax=Brachionus calyciflorus TaxID=104777 RepID=A0A813UR66_9BILA|nr:unnamed protein product [Brachionus calyciflorus]
MFLNKQEIIGYFSDQINLIDLQCEKALIALESCAKKDEEKNLVNTTRKLLISKDFAKLQIFSNLVREKERSGEFLIDLTNPNENNFNNLTLHVDSNKTFNVNPNDLDFIQRNINMKKFFLSHSNLKRIPGEIFRFMKSLNLLDIMCDKLIYLQENNFKHLENLTCLRIHYCKIEFIETNAFSGLKSLRELDLYGNKIKKFGKGAFNDLENLKYLNLSKNCIEILKDNTFNGLKSLHKLVLDENRIRNFGKEAFNDLENLKYLNLDRNCIEILKDNTLSLLSNLEYLLLTDNPLSQIESDAFNGLKNLSFLDIGNSHRYWSTESLNFDSTVFQPCTGLKIINLGKNNVNLTSEYFNKLTSLQFLNIRHNMIDEINFLNKMQNLEILDLQFINTKEFNENFEKLCLPNLKFLVITCETVPRFNSSFSNLKGIHINRAKNFQNGAFVNLLNLDYFRLRTNDQKLVDKLEKESFKGLKSLKYFAFEINTYPYIDLKDQLKDKESVFMSLLDPQIEIKPVLFYSNGSSSIKGEDFDFESKGSVNLKLLESDRIIIFLFLHNAVMHFDYYNNEYYIKMKDN